MLFLPALKPFPKQVLCLNAQEYVLTYLIVIKFTELGNHRCFTAFGSSSGIIAFDFNIHHLFYCPVANSFTPPGVDPHLSSDEAELQPNSNIKTVQPSELVGSMLHMRLYILGKS